MNLDIGPDVSTPGRMYYVLILGAGSAFLRHAALNQPADAEGGADPGGDTQNPEQRVTGDSGFCPPQADGEGEYQQQKGERGGQVVFLTAFQEQTEEHCQMHSEQNQ